MAEAQRSTVRISFQDQEQFKNVTAQMFPRSRVDLGQLPQAASEGFCTGTLIARNFVLTAGHCVDSEYFEQEHPDHILMPRVLNRQDGRLTHEELGRFLKADFNAQLKYSASNSASIGAAGPQEPFSARVVEVYESDYDGEIGAQWRKRHGKAGKLDFAILRLDRDELKPWVQPIGLSKMVFTKPHEGQALAIIQHPNGGDKKVATGSIQSVNKKRILYANVSTLPGSSGAGVLTAGGKLVAIHTRGPKGGCEPSIIDDGTGTSANQGQRIAFIKSILTKLLTGEDPNSVAPAVTPQQTANPSP